jgi:cytochrome b pre-mRNA-processing protein 3
VERRVLSLRRKKEDRAAAQMICAALLAQARKPAFFVELRVPDTFDGRFDLAVLHAWLMLERLRSAGYGMVAQALVDDIFVNFDEALRDLGASDMSMGRKLKKIANAFYGRLSAYGSAADIDALAAAIGRNVYRGEAARAGDAARLATYALVCRSQLAQWTPEDGSPVFGPLPQIVNA